MEMSAEAMSLVLSSSTPFVAVMIMALLSAINPCPLATIVSSILYLTGVSRSGDRPWSKVLFYALGRALLYFFLGILSVVLLRTSIEMLHLQEQMLYALEHFLGPLLVLLGVLFLIFGREHGAHHHHHPVDDDQKEGESDTRRTSWFGSLALGMSTALFFCPATGLIYFGFLVPLVSQSPRYGLPLLAVYSLLTASVVIPTYAVMSLGLKRMQRISGGVQRVQRVLTWVVGILFIVIGIALFADHLLHGHHH